MIDYEDDVVKDASVEQLGQLGALVTEVGVKEAAIAEAAQRLKDLEREWRVLVEQDIPSIMDEIGMAKITMADGSNVAVDDFLYASIPKKNKRAVADWLAANNLESLVSRDVVTHFERGEEELIQQTVDLIREHGFACTTTESMNTGSVKSAIRELLDNGVDVPMKLFGAYMLRKAVIKR